MTSPAGGYDPLIPTGPAPDAGPQPVDPDANYTPALTPSSQWTVLHQNHLEKLIDARVAQLKAAGTIT